MKLDILIVDDEPLITLFIKDVILEIEEHHIEISHDSASAINHIKKSNYDIIFMDINIGDSVDGISIIKHYLKNSKTIVFYISAYNSDEIISEALSTQPYNYLIKPINEEDIKIAIKLAKNMLLKHEQKEEHKDLSTLKVGENLNYNLLSQTLLYKNNEIPLSNIEHKLIKIFAQSPNINLSYETLEERVWNNQQISDSTIRDHISSLRKKIPSLNIKTNFGRGYILQV